MKVGRILTINQIIRHINNDLVYRKILVEEVDIADKFNTIGINSWMREFFSQLTEPSVLFGCFTNNNKLIGTEGYIGYKLYYGCLEISTHRSERTLVSNNFRGKGIFTQLISNCDEFAISHKSCLVWGATTALKPFMNAGFETYIGFRSYIFLELINPFKAIIKSIVKPNFPLNPIKLYKAYKYRNLATIIEIVAFLSTLTSIFKISTKIEISNIEIKENYLSLDDILILKNKVFDNTDIYSININQDFIDWMNSLGRKYKYYSFYERTQMIGYLITDEDNNSYVLRIVDFCFLDRIWVAPIFTKFKKFLNKAGYSNILIVLNLRNKLQNEYSNELIRMGGFMYGKVGSFVVKNFKNQYHKYTDISQMYLTDIWLAL